MLRFLGFNFVLVCWFSILILLSIRFTGIYFSLLGLSDPYCMLGILKDTQGRKVSKDGKKVKKIVLTELQDEERVQMTKVKDDTLNPVWNEQFKLYVSIK